MVETGVMDRKSQLSESIIHRMLSYLNNTLLVRMSVLSNTWFHLTASFPVLHYINYRFRSPEIGYMDMISQLPEYIIHHILSLISPSQDRNLQLVRTSVLSKKWFHLIASFPILDFTLSNFPKGPYYSCRECFFKYIEYATSTFCHNNVIAQTFNLRFTFWNRAELDIVNRCIELVLENGVRELEINIFYDPHAFVKPKYRLPNILLSVSVLKSLTICGCDLPSSLMVNDVKSMSLIKLTLLNVTIDDEVIKYLTTCCPLLQELQIKICDGFKRFCVYGHQNLQKVAIYYKTPVERIDITEAPNLSYLSVADWDEIGAPRMNLASCKKLTTVSYQGNPLPNSNGFTNFLSNFPFIEDFALTTKYKRNNLELSSLSLRTLMLHSNYELEEIELSTPNLAVFNYSCNVHILWPLVRDLTHLKACMQYFPDCHIMIDAVWFQKLRQFLDKESGFRFLNLHIHTTYSQFLRMGDWASRELEKIKANDMPPYELEHVELRLHALEKSSMHVDFMNAVYVDFVDAVLWCFRPRTLTLYFNHTGFEVQSDFVKFTCEKLLQQEDQGNTNIQFVSPASSLLMPTNRKGKTIRFIKEEVEAR